MTASTRLITLPLAVVFVAPLVAGCDTADPEPPRSLSKVHEDVQSLSARIEAAEVIGPDDIEEKTQLEHELDRAYDLAAPSDPAGYDQIDCVVADAQLSLAAASFSMVEFFSLQNYAQTGYSVHYNASVHADAAGDSALSAAAVFDPYAPPLTALAQAVAALELAGEALEHAQDVENTLQGRLAHTGSHVQSVEDSLEDGITATENAIAAFDDCF
ncbi:MAG: hypothetical protein AB1Z98_21110 [Nannocystaceae bacterium]